MKNRLNQPDVETTTTIGIFTNNVEKSIDITIDKKTGFAVPQTKNVTIEEVKKEWEKLIYTWIETKDEILLMSKKKQIFIDKKDKMFSCTGHSTNFISLQEHQLLNKTFRALGW